MVSADASPDVSTEPEDQPSLHGFRIGVTAARKVEEQIQLFTRRGAEVVWGPALSLEPNLVDADALRAATERVLAEPVDIFLATTGVGMKGWFSATQEWGLYDALVAGLGQAEILARGPKSMGVLRRHGLRELWSPDSECFDDVLAHLRGRDLTGRRIVVQEHGQDLSMVAHALRRQGARVETVAIYRVERAEDPARLFALIDQIADCSLDAVTFTAAPAVAALMEAAASVGRRDEVVSAFQSDVLACCVGPVAAAAFERHGVPTVYPERSRLGAMVRLLETELPLRRQGFSIGLATGSTLLLHGDAVLLDGAEVHLSGSPLAVLNALVTNPGQVVSRADLLAHLPSGGAGSEHAVEMAVARLRSALGTRAVQTVIKRGYRLAVQ
ncbi:uroporphyrinogen-III synthase [Nocardioides jishulii]|uniref:Uroporphyrinogen-III synthase n=1 Tax=Nocardioides jishulii TaxID=2575440 RepID=A0A4U2YTU4_9ACTN|nr:uroporphyrinogen-III synthase [Nocardioides jishulii]QCX28798.1 uroporphyrinogen-III synthase [Nocardioides jishulii]TKI64305.1 uroporphyrinogen-III synthase [Nocardioides jishulii]